MNVLKLEKKVSKNKKLSCCFYKKKAIDKKILKTVDIHKYKNLLKKKNPALLLNRKS